MERRQGTISRGIRCPIIREGDNIVDIAVDNILLASKDENFALRDRDIVCLTESIVARSQGNYATVDNIATDIKKKFGENATLGLTFPILSRNRFSMLLKGIARGCKKIFLMLSYPSDEVGNALLTYDDLDAKNINPYSDVLELAKFIELFGNPVHEFTGVDYVDFYTKLVKAEGCEIEIIFANQVQQILKYTDNVLCCDIHTRARSKRILLAKGAKKVLGLDDILTESVNGSGFNEKYGLLGSNKASEDRIKLFPKTKESQELVIEIQKKLKEKTSKDIEVMIYGDGAFKDPQGKIWELADPVVSPAFTEGLKGTPNELKLKYLADGKFPELKGEELKKAIEKSIREKDLNLKGKMVSEGTTPRQLTDLIGSLCDLTSGSGDKGTPIVLIQGYFDNYTSK